MKIVTTAVFSILLLKKKLSLQQWGSIIALSLGIGAVQVSQAAGGAVGAGVLAGSNSLGLISVLAACITSGLAGGNVFLFPHLDFHFYFPGCPIYIYIYTYV
jgi:hypothetical protein